MFFFKVLLIADVVCPNCNEVNPDGSKFCGYCGAPIATSLPTTLLQQEDKLQLSTFTPVITPTSEVSATKLKVEEKKNIEMRQSKKTLTIGIASVVSGLVIFLEGNNRDDITNIFLRSSVKELKNNYIGEYNYPEGVIWLKNEGNTVLKNFIVKVSYYDSAEMLIKTEHYPVSSILEPNKEIMEPIRTDAGKKNISYAKIEVVDYSYDKIYKIRNENLMWCGATVFVFGIYNLLKYYNHTIFEERFNSKNSKKRDRELVFVSQGLYLVVKF